MKKTNKTLNIVLICLVATAAIAFGVCKLVIPEQTQLFLDWAWINLNKPLPVVGVSTLALGIVLWRLFASTSFGKKKYNELSDKFRELCNMFYELKQAKEESEDNLKKELTLIRKEKDELLEYVNNIKRNIPNKKVRELKYERKEETHD